MEDRKKTHTRNVKGIGLKIGWKTIEFKDEGSRLNNATLFHWKS